MCCFLLTRCSLKDDRSYCWHNQMSECKKVWWITLKQVKIRCSVELRCRRELKYSVAVGVQHYMVSIGLVFSHVFAHLWDCIHNWLYQWQFSKAGHTLVYSPPQKCDMSHFLNYLFIFVFMYLLLWCKNSNLNQMIME